MKNLLLAIIISILASSCSQKSLPVSSSHQRATNYSNERPKQYAVVMANPAHYSHIDYRDANGTLIRENYNIYTGLADTSSAYSRIIERYKKFPDHIHRNRVYGDSYSNDPYQGLRSTMGRK